MQHSINRRFKRSASLLSIAALAFFQPGCSTLSSPRNGALLVDAGALANIAATAAATYYGGPAAGQLASAGLSALGSVLQGYVGAAIPADVVRATPGVANVGEAVAAVIAPNHTVTQGDVTIVNKAAAIAATLPLSDPPAAAPAP